MRILYNVTGEQRKALVKVIADTTGAKAAYKGMPTAAYEIDYFTVTKDGTLEFSDRSDSEEVSRESAKRPRLRKKPRKRPEKRTRSPWRARTPRKISKAKRPATPLS